MAQEISKYSPTLPDSLRGPKQYSIGNIDASDLIIPRIKLLQAVSPEVTEIEGAKTGEFWHVVLQMSLGKELTGVPIILRKTHVLWAPRGDDRGILARSPDGKHWDPPEGQFEIKFKGNPKTYIWKLAPTVAESGLDQFGSSRDDDKSSPPAAALTYETLWWFPDQPFGPAIILNSRGSANVTKNWLTMIDAKPGEHFNQVYSVNSVVDKGPNNEPFFNYQYRGIGFLREDDTIEKAKEYYLHFKDVAFRASDQRSEEEGLRGGSRPQGQTERTEHTKF